MLPARLLWSLVPVVLVALGVWVGHLYLQVLPRFEGQRWALPATVYARPLELFAGMSLSPKALTEELELLRYERGRSVTHEGSYSRDREVFHLGTRGFRYWDGDEPARRLRLVLREGRVAELQDLDDRRPVPVARLDPVRIGSFSTAHGEDRLLLRLEDVPDSLIDGLLAVEDRGFYRHLGVQPSAIARATWANLRAGRTVQGGSTLTQQLVKSYFLTSERSLWRKANEAVMALLLEARHDKREILEAYINEVYLVQDRARAIHGFGLASRFLFGRKVSELDLPRQALLIALIKGPSYYDPRRHPQRARTRRNLVLEVMAAQGVVSPAEAAAASTAELGISPHAGRSDAVFPAFLDLVRRQLRRDYRDQDLRSEGLRIFTSLDPAAQRAAEVAVGQRLAAIEAAVDVGSRTDRLQAALVLTRLGSGEVLALVGDRNARYPGFNRALDAVRPVGSLVKPAVYLTALEQSDRWTLASRIADTPLRVADGEGKVWQPRNYDQSAHGEVSLYEALVQSYNLATTRLGLEVGIPAVATTLHRLGLQREVSGYPSMLLGGTSHSPFEMAQVFQSLADGGFRTPLRSILAVQDRSGEVLERYPLRVTQVAGSASVYLINEALEGVVREGTASGLPARLPPGLRVAGKTGTTNDLRDSWFAGFTGEHLAVVWVGRDDNAPMGLTGSSGALPVWADLVAALPTQALQRPLPEGVQVHYVERDSGRLSAAGCENVMELPFAQGTVPQDYASCGPSRAGGVKRWLQRVFR